MTLHRIQFLERWRRYRNLSLEERGLILRGMVLLSLTVLGLRTMSFRRCREFIRKFSLTPLSPPQIQADRRTEIRGKLVSAMNAVERNGPWRPNCLERSLALWWLLQLKGVDGELLVGGRMNLGRFEAHAWVEWEGQVLNDSTDVHKHYSRFDAPIAATEADPGIPVEEASRNDRKGGLQAHGKAASQ